MIAPMQMKPTEQLSIVIPMYNEAENVTPLINEVGQALAKHPDFEIIVVDDGSRDRTWQKLTELTKIHSQLRILRHKRNLGQSVGIFSGILAATKPWIMTLDGDGQNDPKDIMLLVKSAEENMSNKPLLIAGHRVNRKDSGWKKFGSKFANSIRRGFLKDNCPDTGCGIKLLQKDLFLTLPHFNHCHRFLPALWKRAGGQVINVPVNHRPRTRGKSKYGNIARLKVGIIDLLGVAWLMRRPCVSELENDTTLN
jgi:dolichol-phosphate mannosyltransferase